jgi:hypothetical protein
MNAAHQMVGLEDASPGMALSDAILDQQGQVLLAQGTVLTAPMIAGLKRHDVAMLPIAISASETPAFNPVAVAARVAYLFRAGGTEDATGPADTATAVLHRYIAAYRLEPEADVQSGVEP